MTCNCGSDRMINVNGKCDDRASISIPHMDVDYQGYIPYLAPGLGDDYIELSICIDCGVVQDWAPKTDEELRVELIEAGIIEADEVEFSEGDSEF